jgi:hypothetical protein
MLGTWRAGYIASILLTASICGCLTTAPSTDTRTPTTTAPTMRGEVSDPTGDAVALAGVANPPDLVHGTVDILAGNITFTMQFASATYDRQTTGVLSQLDTDQNPSTGISSGSGFGIDYVVTLWAPTNQVQIQRALANGTCITTDSNRCFATVGAVSLVVNADGVQATVPLSLLGGGDGRLNFRVFAYYVASISSGRILTDVMRDAALPAGSVQ